MQPMPRVPPFDRPATYDDLVKLPDNLVAEIVDGELHASPRPALRHSRAELSLGRAIAGPYDDGVGGPGGWWILVEPELHLGRNVLVPDLAGWRRTRMPEVPDAAYCHACAGLGVRGALAFHRVVRSREEAGGLRAGSRGPRVVC